MVMNINIAKSLKLLVLIPTILLLFACTKVDDNSTIIENTEDNVALEVQHRECWQSAIVGAIYDTTSHITMGMYAHMTQGAMALMMVAFAIWLAFRMIKHVSSFTEDSPAEVWSEVMKKFFLCFVCGLLASSPTGVIWVLNSLIFPIYNAFLELGSEMLSHLGEEGKAGSNITSIYIPFIGDVESKYPLLCTVTNMDPATPEGFPTAPKQMMECLICAVNERLNFGFKLGWVIMSQPGFMAIICGLIMVAIFFFVKIGFVFYLVDSIFRFSLMVLMLPILIMAYAFKPTRKWTTTGFTTILNSAAFMMCIAIVILMAIVAVQQILIDNKELIEANETSLADFSVPFLMLLLVGFLLVGSMDIAKSIANSIIGGGGENNFQKKVATGVLKVGKWAAMGILTGGAGLAVANSSKLRAMKGKMKEMQANLASMADDDDDES